LAGFGNSHSDSHRFFMPVPRYLGLGSTMR
jgi:hypothetical protein